MIIGVLIIAVVIYLVVDMIHSERNDTHNFPGSQ